jgi:hypothetical protein
MKKELSLLEIRKNVQYECLITTKSRNGTNDAIPSRFTYLGEGKIRCHIPEGSKTLENIMDTKEYACNITQDSLAFTHAALNGLGDEYYSNETPIPTIKNASAYIIVDLCGTEIEGDNGTCSITGKIRDMVINDESAMAFNRGLDALIESLTNLSRYKIVDDAKRSEYLNRLYENQRLIKRVSDEKTKRVMENLKKEYEKTDF